MTAQSLPQPRSKGKHVLISVGISLFTLIGLVFAFDGETHLILRQADPSLLVLAALKAPALVLLWALRWHLVLRTRQFPVHFHQTLVATLMRTFFNCLTPGFKTGGEPVGTCGLQAPI